MHDILSKMYIGLYVKYLLILIKHEFSRQVFEKYWINRFHKNPSSGVRLVAKWTDGQRDKRDEGDSHLLKFFEPAKKRTCKIHTTQTHHHFLLLAARYYKMHLFSTAATFCVLWFRWLRHRVPHVSFLQHLVYDLLSACSLRPWRRNPCCLAKHRYWTSGPLLLP